MLSLSARTLAIALVSSLVFAGCISDKGPTNSDGETARIVPADWWVDAVPSSITDPDHNHSLRSHHLGITTPNFEVLGWDPMVTDHFGTTLTGMGCGGAVTREDGRRLAVVHSISTKVSFVVADITDPAAPRMVGEFYLPNAVVWDATISGDGEHVLIGAYPPVFGNRGVTLPVGGDASSATDAPDWAKGHDGRMLYRSACSGEVVAVGPSNYLPGPAIVLVGIQDPEEPVFEDYVPQPVIGPHSVGSQMIDGVVYATSSVTNLLHEGSYYTFYEIADTPAGYKLQTLSVLQTPGVNTQRAVTDSPGEATPFLNGHTDVYLHKHPKTGQVLAYLANWDGLYVYDLSTPETPTPVSKWFDGTAGSVHTTLPFTVPGDDTQYLIVAQEVGEPTALPSGWVYILDVDDPTNPTELGRWTLPVKPKWDNGGLQFSPHYVAVLNHTLFVTNYHGGMWAVDITDMEDPAAIGIFVPENESPNPYGGKQTYGPSVGDVIVDPDTWILTTWDGAGGVYQLRFHDQIDAPRAPSWQSQQGQEHQH